MSKTAKTKEKNMMQSETITKISAALLKAQKQIGAAKKGDTNPFFHSTYASLGSVMEACKEALNENGITVLQPIMEASVETVLLHESGEWLASSTPIVSTKAHDPQALGSAVSYAKRYGLQSMVFIPSEDDDGERAMARKKPSTQRPPIVSRAENADSDVNQDKCPHCGSTSQYHAKTCPNFQGGKIT